ncbi:MAG: HEAT repeat domain-containing protein [Candidatus Natronoplasma sp.]
MDLFLGGRFYGLILNLLLIFAGSLLGITILYIVLVYKNVKERQEIESKRDHWEEKLREYSQGELDPKFWEDEVEKRKKFFGNFLIEKAREGEHDLELLRDIYIDLGFVQEDNKRLNSDKWHKKTKTLERWTQMGILPKEKEVLNLLTSENNEVRLAALNLLSHHGHPVLGKNVKAIFNFYGEHVDDYLLVKLITADIPIEYLQTLTRSERDRLKREGVILLGREGEKESIEVLKSLKKDGETIRYEIARSLGRIRNVEVVELLDMMKEDESPNVRREVARSLGRIFQRGIIDDSGEEVRSAIQGREKTTGILEELVKDEEYEVRVAAFLALSNLEEEGRDIINEYREEYPRLAKEALLKSFSGGVSYDAV